jgi:hypothetical protein
MSSKKSNRQLSKAENGQIRDHSHYMKTYRSNVMRVLRDVRAGKVSEEDLDKLQNFCQMSLSLMETAPMHQIESAWRHAEILAFTHEQVEDVEIVPGQTEPQRIVRKSDSVSPFVSKPDSK